MSNNFLESQGICPICEQSERFQSKYAWLRDHFLCSGCKSIPRERALMYVIQKYYPAFRELAIHESSPVARGTSLKLAKQCPAYLASQYDTSVTFGEPHPKKNYRSEDLENQTFDDESFDLVITQDVLEHLFHPDQAFAEIARTLKPGGAHIFTTPLVNRLQPSQRAASIDENGEIEYFCEPEYHGNPIDRNGSLVTMRWGYDICDYIARACGLHTTIIYIDDLSQGIRAEFIEVLLTYKPTV